MSSSADWIKMRIGDELGLVAEDLVRLYGVPLPDLDTHLTALESSPQAAVQRILSDVDGVRMGYRIIIVTDQHLAAIRERLRTYPFHPLVSAAGADGAIGWHLGGDDAQFVAFRMADIVGIDFDWSDVLRMRLHRLILHYSDQSPEITPTFRDRVVDVAAYLIELTGIL